MQTVKIAACQIDISLGKLDSNFEKVTRMISLAVENKAQIIIFPECVLSGYCLNSAGETESMALEKTSPYLSEIFKICGSLNVFCILGFIEKEENSFYNSAGIFGPEGYFAGYRKVHLPVLGVDRFVSPGNLGFPVFDTPLGKIGLNICYDQRFPESARVLMLNGAQLIIVPTNEPDTAKGVCDLLTRARAYENRVFYAWVNRIGTERKTTFMGRSQIIDCSGTILAKAGDSSEEIIYAEIIPDGADKKSSVYIPGEYEIDLLRDRVPEYYNKISINKKQ